MYQCENGCIFEVPGTYTEDFGYMTEIGWHPAVQRFDCCPCCGASAFAEGYVCERCGKFVDFVEEIDGEEVCEECADKYYEKIEEEN